MPERSIAQTNRISFIPARGGSKRIPQKNVREFLGRPMIEWPIRACLDSRLFDSVIVSTDDVEINQLALKLGAKVLMRDANLADDFTHTTAVLKDAIPRIISLHDNPWIYKIYPTSPVSVQNIKEFVNFTEMKESGFSISVSRASLPIQRALTMGSDWILRFREPEFALTRTQDLDPVFFDAGKLYGGRKTDWQETNTPLLSSARGFEMPEWLSVDLDTIEDWELAEYKFRRKFGA